MPMQHTISICLLSRDQLPMSVNRTSDKKNVFGRLYLLKLRGGKFMNPALRGCIFGIRSSTSLRLPVTFLCRRSQPRFSRIPEMLLPRGLLILLSFLTVFQFTYSRPHERKRESRLPKNDFDILIFAQRWPTVCFESMKHYPSPNCRLPRHDKWTIHGIWPTKYHTVGPSYCNNNTQQLNESNLSPIVNQLDEKWPDIGDNTTHFSFWQYEWEKHGSCASGIEDLNTEFKYFQKGLDLLNQYDMTQVLANANILPGHHYVVEEIIDGVQKILGKTIQVTCLQNQNMTESYLVEIRICLDKTLKLTDCNGIYKFPTNCDRNIPVNYTQRPQFPNITSRNN